MRPPHPERVPGTRDWLAVAVEARERERMSAATARIMTLA
jgi:hypothetical protein